MPRDEINPYASSDAPVAAEEVPPSRLRFYAVCFACAVLLGAAIFGIVVARLPQWSVWIAMVATWVGGVAWALWPELRKAGGIRNVGVGRLVVIILGVAVYTFTFLFLLAVAVSIADIPIST